MQFLNPSILFGLLAASVPLILHLINLRRNRQVEFSSNRFLEELKKSNIKNIKIKNLLLLILRILIIAALVFAFARPVIDSGLPLMQTEQPSSNVVVIDNSFSLELATGEGQALQIAKKRAMDIVDELPAQSEVAILTAESQQLPSFLSDKTEVMEEISKIQLYSGALELPSRGEMMENIFKDASFSFRNIFLISDAQEANGDLQSEYPIFYNDLSGEYPTDIQNLGIDSISVGEELLVPGGELAVTVYISNTGNSDVSDAELQLLSGEQILSKTKLAIEEKRSQIKEFTVAVPENGVLSLQAQLSQDMIETDNSSFLALSTPPLPRVALLSDGQSSFYLEKLFDAVSNGEGTYETLNENEIMSQDLSSFGLLVISSGTYSKSTLELLSEEIRKGKPALVFAPLDSSKEFEEFLISIGYDGLGWQKPEEALSVSIDSEHPAVSGIFTETYGNIDDISVGKLLNVTGADSYIRVDGRSLFTEGNGASNGIRSVFVGVSSDLSYSDFPLLKSYAPFIYKSVLYLSGVRPDIKQFVMNNLVELEIGGDRELVQVEYPNGELLDQTVSILGSSRYLDMGYSAMRGNYIVRGREGVVLSAYSVNHEAQESVLEFMDDLSDEYVIMDGRTPISEYLSGHASQTELWQLFVILAIILAITESWIGSSKS